MSYVIKGKITKHASLRGQDGDPGIPFDVSFKIIENENASFGNNEANRDAKEIMAHKFILASYSPVFKRMFYGAMKESKDVIPVEQSTAAAFSLLIDYFYHVDINCEEMSIEEIFELVNLAERYDVPELMDELTRQLEIVPITMKNIMEVATTASRFSYFEAASSTLLMNCAKVFKEIVTKDREQIDFMVAQHEKGNGSVALEVLTLVKSLQPLECDNCHEKECLAGRMVPWGKLEEGLRARINEAEASHYKGVWGSGFPLDKRWTVLHINPGAQTFHLRDEIKSLLCGPYSLVCAGGASTLVYDC